MDPLRALILDDHVPHEVRVAIIPELLKRFPIDVNYPSSALLLALKCGRPLAVIKAIVENSACDLNAGLSSQFSGEHPAVLALEYGVQDIAEYLIKRKGNAPQWLDAFAVIAAGSIFPRIVVTACAAGARPSAMMEILRPGVDDVEVLTIRAGSKQDTSVLLELCANDKAAPDDRFQVCAYLVKSAKIDVNQRAPRGPTALAVLRASSAYDHSIEGLLKDNGAKVVRSWKSYVLLMMSITVSVTNFVQLSSVPFVVGNPWPTSYAPVEDVFQFTLLNLDRISALRYRVLSWMILAAVGIFVFLAILYRSRGPTKILLPVLLPSAWLLAIVAYLPIVHNLIATFRCDFDVDPPTLLRDGTPCTARANLINMGLTAAVILPYTLITMRLNRVDGLWNKLSLDAPHFWTRLVKSWSHDDYGSKPQNLHLFSKNPLLITKVAIAIILLKLLMVAAAVFLSKTLLPLAITNLIISFLFLVFSLAIPSYINRYVNAMHVGAYCSVVWTNIAALWTVIVNDNDDKLNLDDDKPLSFVIFISVWGGAFVVGGLISLVILYFAGGSKSYQARLKQLNEKLARRRERRAALQKRLALSGTSADSDAAYKAALLQSKTDTSKYAPKPEGPAVPLRPTVSESPAELRASYEAFLPGAKAPKGKRPTAAGTRQPPHLVKAGGKNYRADSETSHSATETETDFSYASDVPPRKNVRR